ncbi:SRPBCC domain-containing protein [Dehalococcoidia bacterium]|nr:SRPBCC domain-containing protein [Dehalococcoidia bacterium]
MRQATYREVPEALHIAVTVPCPTPRARDLLVTADGLKRWMATRAEFTPEVGASYHLELDAGGLATVEGQVTGFDPASGIAYTMTDDGVRKAFGNTIVRWSWEPLSADYTLITLTQTGHGQGDSWQRAFDHHLKRWTFLLGNLVSVVTEALDQRPR